jgi:hypothetical protein
LKKVSLIALMAGLAFWMMKRSWQEQQEPEPEMAMVAVSDTSPSEG